MTLQKISKFKPNRSYIVQLVSLYSPYQHTAFSEYHLHLPGILNKPFCCMTLLAIEWSFCSDRQWRLPMLLNGSDNPWKLSMSLPLRGSSPMWHMVPRTHSSHYPKGISIGSANVVRMGPKCYAVQCTVNWE